MENFLYKLVVPIFNIPADGLLGSSELLFAHESFVLQLRWKDKKGLEDK